jgi:hypothetical protein
MKMKIELTMQIQRMKKIQIKNDKREESLKSKNGMLKTLTATEFC